MHRELASRAFTDALLRLANDRNTHQQVKAKILERMQEWADMFKDPDLGIMKDQYHKLKSQNPNLHPPSAPQKSRLTDLGTESDPKGRSGKKPRPVVTFFLHRPLASRKRHQTVRHPQEHHRAGS